MHLQVFCEAVQEMVLTQTPVVELPQAEPTGRPKQSASLQAPQLSVMGWGAGMKERNPAAAQVGAVIPAAGTAGAVWASVAAVAAMPRDAVRSRARTNPKVTRNLITSSFRKGASV